MRTVRQGDRVQVHYLKRSERGAVASSRGRKPVEITVGTEHRRLPGLGLALVGLREGERARMLVPAEKAYGLVAANRTRRLARSRFPDGQVPEPGRWVRVADRSGRRRLVRVVDVAADTVVVDLNHPWAGQAVDMVVKVVSIQSPLGEAGPTGTDRP